MKDRWVALHTSKIFGPGIAQTGSFLRRPLLPHTIGQL